VSAADSPLFEQQPVLVQALADLRAARRRKRLQDIHWVDAFYRVYLSALLGLALLVVVSGLVGGKQVDVHAMHRAIVRGPALLGLLSALAVGIGLRSGSRGGPIALEGPDVRHVLMSPVSRAVALRGPAIRQVRFAVFLGTVVGGAAGIFAHRRLGHNAVAFVASGALYGAVTATLGVAAALVASGRRLRRWMATAVAIVLLGWSGADAADKVGHVHAPTNFVGRIATWPLHFDAWAFGPIVVVVLLAALGLRGIAGLSVEHAERRTALVGQLRFAVTMQDLRTVLVLRRQLAMELPRETPWFGGRSKRRARFPVLRRDWRGVLRWPAARLIRLLLLAIAAGFALRAAWNGTVPLVVAGGLALWLAALDAVEAMSQETDHPSRRDSYPIERGLLHLRHVVVPTFVMVVVVAVAAGVGVLTDPSKGALAVVAIAILPATLAAVAGAAVSVVMGAPASATGGGAFSFAPPEFAGMTTVVRAAWPPAVAVIGTLPLLAARSAHLHGKPPIGPELGAAVGVLVVVALALWWVRMQERFHLWWSALMEEGVAQQKARAEAREAARSGTARDDEDGE